MGEAEDIVSTALSAPAEDVQRVSEMLSAADADAPRFWETGTERWIPVGDGEIRVIHCIPEGRPALRPIVLVPGFGVLPEGFQEFYRAVHGKAELFYVETREKSSSRLQGRRPDMSVARSARDLRAVLATLGLTGGRDFVLVGVCWGATIMLEGMIAGLLEAPTVLLADPMHTLWFPKWVLRWVSPLVPAGAAAALRPVLFKAMLGDMREPAQKERTRAFVYGADVRKWKRSAEAARDVELFGRLHAIGSEIYVLNGTADKVHDPRHYPLLARELPRGRFLYMSAGEHQRERLFGTAALEFARVGRRRLPAALGRFEKNLRPGPRSAVGTIIGSIFSIFNR